MLQTSVRIGVVITTYNSPAWLEKVLWGYAKQSDANYELIIADDGSAQETAAIVQQFKDSSSVPIHHVWHEDQGFRKTIILNKAIQYTSAEYLIFTDGDCIPRKDFIATHRQRAQKGCFLSGGYYKLTMQASKAIKLEHVMSQEAFNFSFLQKHHQPKNFKRTKLTKSPIVRKCMELITPTSATWNGMNSSAYKQDIESINGFDERMQYGGLDREMGERLVNKGLKGVQIRYSAICLHLDHARGYSTKETWERNRSIRDAVKKHNLDWTEYGILKGARPVGD